MFCPDLRSVPPRLRRLIRLPGLRPLAPGGRPWLLPLAALLLLASLAAHADLPPFLQHVVGASSAEAALYRLMHLPQADVLYPRPPREATAELTGLIGSAPTPELLALRARSEEAAMDYPAAEADWKSFVAHSRDGTAAREELAAYYGRRLEIAQELPVLAEIAAAPPPASELYSNPDRQRPWRASVRSLALIREQALPPAAEDAAWTAFLARYPDQPALYARYFNVLLDRGDDAAAEALIARMHAALPADLALELECRAALAVRRGNPDAALAVYSRAFDPQWPAPVLANYFALLNRTHRAHSFLAEAQASLAANPDDLAAATRIFLFFEQGSAGSPGGTPQPNLQAARATLARFRIAKETRHAPWSPLDLYTLTQLSLGIADYPEAARYSFALAGTSGTLPDGEPAAQAGLSSLVAVLLTAPDQPIALGAGNLSLYRDIATLDTGPGYWNGILSLWLNGTNPAGEYAAETEKAQPYFHRAKAAALLAELDGRYPAAPQRPALHLQLLQATAQYGDPAATIDAGRQFLAAFPRAAGRVEVATLTADSYARQNDLTAEFALYDTTLAELAAQAKGQPLSASAQAASPGDDPDPSPQQADFAPDEVPIPAVRRPPTPQADASAQYTLLLDRYLSRLTATDHLPQALAVLRRQLDLSPDDPLLYERLATFLQQNNLSAGQEAVYKLAIARFPGTSWQDRLARFYLKSKRRADFAALTRQVTQIFSGTDLDAWFSKVQPGDAAIGPALALQLNRYAAARFPHDLVFTTNLLTAYAAKPTANPAALAALLRRHWWESPALRDRFFEHLSQTGQLDRELSALAANVPASKEQSSASSTEGSADAPGTDLSGAAGTDPAAVREEAEALLWRSRFEQATPLLAALSSLYPADPDLGDRTVSLFRSLSYEQPSMTARAVAVERRLLVAEPDSPDRLSTLGDLYAEATATGGEDLAAATPFWRQIPQLHPGTPAGYLTAATLFWDYFQFDDALAELTAARQRFGSSALFGYEAGAIEENRRDLPAAVREYTLAVVQPPARTRRNGLFFAGQSAAAAETPSDTAESDLLSTATGSGSDLSRDRLLSLARRPDTAALVDRSTAQALAAGPNLRALTLRVDVLVTQSRQGELTPALTSALAAAGTPAEAAAVGVLARTHSLTTVYEASLDRQTTLTADPVERIQLQFALARSEEDRHDIAAASYTVAQVYNSNPRLLGVVRTTVDFYTRTGQPAAAVGTLLKAAEAANPQLSASFTLEAAHDANAAGNAAQARTLALSLLAKEPYNPQYLAEAAQSYAGARDDAGLKSFYLARLEAARTTAPASERKADVALLRRGLIPALTGLNDPAGAEDQYLALIAAYPEDRSTANDAALYALAHGRESQLLLFLQKAASDSPSDSRFSILLAQVETTFGDLPAAVATYSRAIAVRSDRADLYTARASLQLRLAETDPDPAAANTGLDAVAADYLKLYTLTYHDPAWMLRLAELRARQGRPEAAAQALEAAYLTGRPQTGDLAVANLFLVARRLDGWNLLPQARSYAERGRTLAGAAFLTGAPPAVPSDADSNSSEDEGTGPDSAVPLSAPARTRASDAGLYARILTRQGHPEQALAALLAARRQAEAASASVLAALYQALADDSSPEDRKALASRRALSIQTGFSDAVTAMSTTIGTEATPEAKARFGLLLDSTFAAPSARHTGDRDVAVRAAHAAGLFDREALWRRQALLTGSPSPAALSAYVQLQISRLRFADLAATLELYAARVAPQDAPAILTQAADAFRSAGDTANELRLTHSLALAADPHLRDRFLDLLLRREPAALAALASGANTSLADAAVNYSLGHGSESQSLALVTARGHSLTPVWLAANTALTGLSFASVSHSADSLTDSSFRQVLAADSTVADRLGKPPDRTRQLSGVDWFPYAASYAVFRSSSPGHGDPEDFAAASLEAAVTQSGPAYMELAETYAEAGKPDAALLEYAHALELSPADPSILDAQAVLQARTGRVPDASSSWHTALSALALQAGRRAVPESFWTTFRLVLQHLREQQLLARFAPEIQAMLHQYLVQSGTYRSDELLQEAFTASADPQQGISLLLASTAGVPQERAILSDLAQLPLSLDAAEPVAKDRLGNLIDLPHQQILLRRVDLARQHLSVSSLGSDPGSTTPAELAGLQAQLVQLYLDRNELAAAAALQSNLQSAPVQAGTAAESTRIQIATRTGALQPLLDQWRAQPSTAPAAATVSSAIQALQTATPFYTPQPLQLRPLLDYSFNQKRLSDTLTATDFLALAENHLDTGDEAGALQLLHRLALQPPLPPASTPEPDSTGDTPATTGDLSASPDHTAGDPAVDSTSNLAAAAHLLEERGRSADAVPLLQLLVRDVPWNSSFRLRLAKAELASKQPAAAAALQRVAADALAPYALRVQAAQALGTSGTHPAGLGSGELDLLAAAKPPTATAVQQPFFAAARERAATAAPPEQADALLRESIALDPRGSAASRARLQLLTALLGSPQPARALPILSALNSSAANASEPSPNYTSSSEISATLPPFLLEQPLPTRIHLAQLIAKAEEQAGDPGQAILYLELALNLDPAATGPERTDLLHSLLRLRATEALAVRNATRLPVVRDTLGAPLTADPSPSAPVRPRLLAAAPPEAP